MRGRCLNPAEPAYPQYGGRGITVDSRWSDFGTFVADMGDRPTGATLERINNDGPYSPSNCRWASRVDQANNRRSSVTVEYNGRTLTIAQWARETGVPYRVLWERITLYKWPLERAFSEPVRRW